MTMLKLKPECVQAESFELGLEEGQPARDGGGVPDVPPASSRKGTAEWELMMAASVAQLLETQNTLEQLKATLGWPQDAGTGYEEACRSVATALVALEECSLVYWGAGADAFAPAVAAALD